MCILDILMPEKNGFQILKEIKTEPVLCDIPVIICTGINDKTAIETALALGAFDYFSKPLTEEAMKISLPLKTKNALALMKRNKEIIYLSYHDTLTGLYNRRFLEEEMKRLDTKANLPFSIMIGDVNGLKLTNDAFGHDAGDKLLYKITAIMKEECRKRDVIARYGGDEFVILMPGTKYKEAKRIMDKIMMRCSGEQGEPIKPSISLGFAAKEDTEQKIGDIFGIAEDIMYNNKMAESKKIKNSIIMSLQQDLYKRTFESEEHSSRFIEMVQKLGEAMGFSEEKIRNLKLLALLHDIGMIGILKGIPQNNKNSGQKAGNKLKKHCEIGYRIASSSTEIAHIAGDILSHHEHWDGTGYPQGLAGDNIPCNARIISVVDTYDSLVYGKSSQAKMTKNEALTLIRKEAGKSFDPVIVESFLKLMEPGKA